jgi:ketosteroid isomerase-like protein
MGWRVAGRDLDEVFRRLEALEDEREIQALLVRYAIACDGRDDEATAAIYAPDHVIELDGAPFVHGQGAVTALPATEGVCSHVMGPYLVQLDGDRAVATGYGTAFARDGNEVKVWRQAYGRWELSKQEGQWRVTRRLSLAAGSEAGRQVLSEALHP